MGCVGYETFWVARLLGVSGSEEVTGTEASRRVSSMTNCGWPHCSRAVLFWVERARLMRF